MSAPQMSGRKAVSLITATIPAGSALSNSIDLTNGAVNYVIAPSNWDDANVSFQVSYDSIAFYDLFDASGFELVRELVPGSAVAINPALTAAAMHLRIRSGTRVAPVNQAADSTFILVLA